MKFYKTQMNPDELAMMLQGFLRNLFEFPKEGEMYSISRGKGNCDIYFETSFHSNYISELEQAIDLGKFANSNANSRWLDLMNKVSNVTEAQLPEEAKDYSVIISNPW